jgi:hypothetical protein
MKHWKANWEESKPRYLEWWQGRGLLINMWEHIPKDGPPHEEAAAPPPPKDLNQFWFDPVWRADKIHYDLSRGSLKADILAVANTQLGPGSLAGILGAELAGGGESIWVEPIRGFDRPIIFDEGNKWWQVHRRLLEECVKRSQGRYFVGMPDLMEGLDTLGALRGTEDTLVDIMLEPEILEEQLAAVNKVWFEVFDRLYEIIQQDGEMAFCYFSIWGPGKVAKLQSDISLMIREDDFARFVVPYLREQARKIDYTLYHLDGVDAMRHIDAILEIEELNCVQWTPGIGQPQGGDPCWFDLYRQILKAGKGVMPCWVELHELEPLLDQVGGEGFNILMHFRREADIDAALAIAEKYR